MSDPSHVAGLFANEINAIKGAANKKDADHHRLINLVVEHDNHFLQKVADVYVRRTGEVLPVAIREVTGAGDYGTLLFDFVIPWANFAARTIHNAVTGAGTNESAIIDVIAHLTPEQIAELKTTYFQIFNQDLLKNLKSDTSGNFWKVIRNVLQAKQNAVGNPEEEAKLLYEKGEAKLGTDDDFFVQFFTHHSSESLRKINDAYKEARGHFLEQAIKNETSGAYQDLLVALVQSRSVYWAKRIRHAVKGLGTNDELLRRGFAINSHEQLKEISVAYVKVDGADRSLRADVLGDTSGLYKHTFDALFNHLSI